MRIDKWWKWIVLVLVVAGIAIGARNLWPKLVPVAVPPVEQVPTATLPTVPTAAEATATPTVSAELMATIVAETATDCCQPVFVDLKTNAPEGVWSNVSGILIPEGWFVVLYRDQLWQQARNEVELRQTWQEGATEDYLLLCNPGPGSRYYSLEGEFGGRPGGHEGFWNDQAKKVWAFPDPNAACQQGNIVLYENDDQTDPGWTFEIPVK